MLKMAIVCMLEIKCTITEIVLSLWYHLSTRCCAAMASLSLSYTLYSAVHAVSSYMYMSARTCNN